MNVIETKILEKAFNPSIMGVEPLPHPHGPRLPGVVFREHPTDGLQYWNSYMDQWHDAVAAGVDRDIHILARWDRDISWESTWAEPESA